jgi:hypothetical protein
MVLDERADAETFIEFTRKQETRIGRDRGPVELDAQLKVEREANRAGFGVTHWMMPSAPARHPRAPAFFAGVERLWSGRFTSQNENAGLSWNRKTLGGWGSYCFSHRRLT